MSETYDRGETDRQLIRLEGEFWTILFAGETCRLRDTKGVRYLEYLLRRPHETVSALEMRFALDTPEDRRDGGARGDPQALERARVNVTRALKGVLGRLESHHPALSAHLRATVRTGAYCTYKPDPRLTVVWENRDR